MIHYHHMIRVVPHNQILSGFEINKKTDGTYAVSIILKSNVILQHKDELLIHL